MRANSTFTHVHAMAELTKSSIPQHPPRPHLTIPRYTITSLKHTRVPHILHAVFRPPALPLLESIRPHGDRPTIAILVFLRSRGLQRDLLSRPLKRLQWHSRLQRHRCRYPDLH